MRDHRFEKPTKIVIEKFMTAIRPSVLAAEWGDVRSILDELTETEQMTKQDNWAQVVFAIRAFVAMKSTEVGFYLTDDGWHYEDRHPVTLEYTSDTADMLADENVPAWHQEIATDKPDHIKFASHTMLAALRDLHFTGAILITSVLVDGKVHEFTQNYGFGMQRGSWPENLANKLASQMHDLMKGPGCEVDASHLPVTNIVYKVDNDVAVPELEIDNWFAEITKDSPTPETIVIATDIQLNCIRVEGRMGRMNLGHIEIDGKTINIDKTAHLEEWPEQAFDVASCYIFNFMLGGECVRAINSELARQEAA